MLENKLPQNACVINPGNFLPVKKSVYKIENLDSDLIEMIRYSATKAYDVVSKHEWMNSQRLTMSARIGHFVTNLRRELIVFIDKLPLEIYNDKNKTCNLNTIESFYLHYKESIQNFLKKFYDSDMWEDIALPKKNGKYSFKDWNFCFVNENFLWKMNWEKIMDLCKQALETQVHSSSKEIDDRLTFLQREIYPLQTKIDTINRINAESNEIISKLCSIVEGN